MANHHRADPLTLAAGSANQFLDPLGIEAYVRETELAVAQSRALLSCVTSSLRGASKCIRASITALRHGENEE